MNKCYVQSMAQVSCQGALTDAWLDSPLTFDEPYVRAQEPDTEGMIAPGEARRMSRILRRAVATSLTALRQSGVEQPDAIITGTGMGCMENSEKFLTDLCQYGESCLKPTLFMQSTHNTIGSLIAMQIKCHGYNNTYSQLDLSFESALFDAWLQMRLGDIGSALVGAHDEVTPLTAAVLRAIRPDYGMISEASVSVVVSNQPSAVEIEEVRLGLNDEPSGATASRRGTAADANFPGATASRRGIAADANFPGATASRRGIAADANFKDEPSMHHGETPWPPLPNGVPCVEFGDCPSSSALRFYHAVRLLERGLVPGGRMTLCHRYPDGTLATIKLASPAAFVPLS